MNDLADDQKFDRVLDALSPYLDRVVIVGGWAHRLFRRHPLAQSLPYPPLMTRDTDIALPLGLTIDGGSLRERLLARGFSEEFSGDDRPPVTHYQLGDDDAGFYVEFLTPLFGGEIRRDGRRDVTASMAGITATKLRHLDVLLVAPWLVSVDVSGRPTMVRIANPVSYIVQKLLIGAKRKSQERAKDFLYIHDTFELFGAPGLTEMRRVWDDEVAPTLGARTATKCRVASAHAADPTASDAYEAARMAVGRQLTALRIAEVCGVAFNQLFA